MYTVFVLGSIASGKSAACSYLSSLGALYIDLDELVKGLYVPGSDIVRDIAERFGFDVLDETGGINKRVLAQRAFASAEEAEALNAIVKPYLAEQLSARLFNNVCCTVTAPSYPFAVVEISVPQNATEFFSLADDVVVISASYEVRRNRALRRGMTLDDFESRCACQLPDDDIASLGTVVIDNSHDNDDMFRSLDSLLGSKGIDVEMLKKDGPHA